MIPTAGSETAGAYMDSWEPMTEQELEALIARQLQDCSPQQQAAFALLRVPIHPVRLHRLGLIEPVLVVAQFAQGLLYFEDVEYGFEIGVPGADGVLPAGGCNQLELVHALNRLGV
jgi:hypothetical protein